MKPIYTTDLKEFGLTLVVYYCAPRTFKQIVSDSDLDDLADVLSDLEDADGYFLAEGSTTMIWLSTELETTKSALNRIVHEVHHLSSLLNTTYQLRSEEYAAYLEGELVSSIFMKLRRRLK